MNEPGEFEPGSRANNPRRALSFLNWAGFHCGFLVQKRNQTAFTIVSYSPIA